MKKTQLLGIVMVLSLSIASGCSVVPSQGNSGGPPEPVSSQSEGANNSSDEVITWDRERACAESTTAVAQWNKLNDSFLPDAREALDGGGPEEADAAGYKYAPEFERIGNNLLAGNIDDVEVGQAITRLGEAMLRWASVAEEGWYTSESFSSATDEIIFATIGLEGLC